MDDVEQVAGSIPMPTQPSDSPHWTIIVPVKQTMHAKTRLTGFDPTTRQSLAISFALDTVAAALSCAMVAAVVVVTNDETRDRFVELGASVVPDQPDAGLNPALVYAAQQVRQANPHASVAALSSDLPALRSADLERAISSAHALSWFVADANGLGTTMLAAATPATWQPRFGRRSRAAHRAAGLEEIEVSGLERLRRDVDTPVDLWDATRLGLGTHTRQVLAAAGLEH
jgi:2-phospho-L-lactate guanylyltransferase